MTKRRSVGTALFVLLLAGGAISCGPAEDPGADETRMADGSDIDRGRYLVSIAGCNDCHTEGFLETGAAPEAEWLLGSSVGWRGPWGTTYAPNLRLTVRRVSEDGWVTMLATRNSLPPMPWASVNHMAEEDARALYRFIQTLEPAGTAVPAALPPDKEPTTPYYNLVPVTSGG